MYNNNYCTPYNNNNMVFNKISLLQNNNNISNFFYTLLNRRVQFGTYQIKE